MRKIIVSVLNLVNLVLLGITFGLGTLTAGLDRQGQSIGTYYQLVWPANAAYFQALNVIGFFALCIAAGLTLFLVVPLSFRKFVSAGNAALLIFTGVVTLLVPTIYNQGSALPVTNQGGLIGMGVLLFVAAAISAFGAVLEFLAEKEAK